MGEVDPAVVEFFARKKKGKIRRKFTVKEDETATNNTENVGDVNETQQVDGWVEVDVTKKAVVKTAGKTLSSMEEVLDDGGLDKDQLEQEKARSAFHWARKQQKQKAPVEEAPVVAVGWRDRMRKREESKLQVDSEMQFPSLGDDAPQAGMKKANAAPVTTNNMWNNFENEEDSEEEEERVVREANAATKRAEAAAEEKEAEEGRQKAALEERNQRSQERQRVAEERERAKEEKFQLQESEAKKKRDEEAARRAEEEATKAALEAAAADAVRFAGKKKKKKKKKTVEEEE